MSECQWPVSLVSLAKQGSRSRRRGGGRRFWQPPLACSDLHPARQAVRFGFGGNAEPVSGEEASRQHVGHGWSTGRTCRVFRREVAWKGHSQAALRPRGHYCWQPNVSTTLICEKCFGAKRFPDVKVQYPLKMAKAKRATAPIAVKPAVDTNTGFVSVNFFDGTRKLIPQGTQILLTVRDGAQNQLFRNSVDGPAVNLELPFHNNFADNYSIVAWCDGYEQAGFQPLAIGPNAPAQLDLMLLKKDSTFHFAGARWSDIQAERPLLGRIFTASVTGDASDAYSELMEEHPDRLASLLNITTAMQQISLPQKSPLDYFKTLDIAKLAPDRIFGYADANLVDQVRLAAQQGEFDTQPALDLTLHGDATSSFKQKQFGEANVQLTFHERNRQTIDGVDCVYVEPDIDYFKDPGAHLLLEVIPNGLTGNVSNPRVVYVLRWIAGRHAGVPDFDPLYTIE